MSELQPALATQVLDASGLACPLPLLKAKLALNQLRAGETLKVIATDAGSQRDFPVFARVSGHCLLKVIVEGGHYTFWLQKKSIG